MMMVTWDDYQQQSSYRGPIDTFICERGRGDELKHMSIVRVHLFYTLLTLLSVTKLGSPGSDPS